MTITAGTEHGAPRPDPGPGKAHPRHTRPRRAALDCQGTAMLTGRGPVLFIPAREFAAVLDAAIFCAAIDQARRAASRTATPTHLVPVTAEGTASA